eukprot:4680212-Amphidinium_carterae.1
MAMAGARLGKAVLAGLAGVQPFMCCFTQKSHMSCNVNHICLLLTFLTAKEVTFQHLLYLCSSRMDLLFGPQQRVETSHRAHECVGSCSMWLIIISLFQALPPSFQEAFGWLKSDDVAAGVNPRALQPQSARMSCPPLLTCPTSHPRLAAAQLYTGNPKEVAIR